VAGGAVSGYLGYKAGKAYDDKIGGAHLGKIVGTTVGALTGVAAVAVPVGIKISENDKKYADGAKDCKVTPSPD